MKSETNRRAAPPALTCWQREAPCACLRVETSSTDAHLFPYHHLVMAELKRADDTQTLLLTFSAHEVEISGHNLRPLLVALQDFAVKWVRAVPERYAQLQASDSEVISRIRIEEAK